MRDFLDGILNFIDCESLTDLEYAQSELTLPLYDQDSYDYLAGILLARDSISTAQERLVAYFRAKGFDPTPITTSQSNILFGVVLE